MDLKNNKGRSNQVRYFIIKTIEYVREVLNIKYL